MVSGQVGRWKDLWCTRGISVSHSVLKSSKKTHFPCSINSLHKYFVISDQLRVWSRKWYNFSRFSYTVVFPVNSRDRWDGELANLPGKNLIFKNWRRFSSHLHSMPSSQTSTLPFTTELPLWDDDGASGHTMKNISKTNVKNAPTFSPHWNFKTFKTYLISNFP